MTTISLNPLFPTTIGFDRFNDLFEALGRDNAGDDFPPHDVVRVEDDRYTVTVAVPGFHEGELTVSLQDDLLHISGQKEKRGGVNYLYQGIATDDFALSFRLADYMTITGAELKDGLLCIDIVREVPEAQKPRQIPINTKLAIEAPASKRAA